jgi:hypothetical protein
VTPAEAAEVLVYASLLDPRIDPSLPDAPQTWVSLLPDWLDRDTALEAVMAHYSASTTRLLPAHVIDFARARRSAEADRVAHEAIAAGVVNVDEVRRRVFKGEPFQLPPPPAKGGPPPELDAARAWRRQVLSVPCPWCKSRPGEPCTTGSIRRAGRLTIPTRVPFAGRVAHPSREDAAREAASAGGAVPGEP